MMMAWEAGRLFAAESAAIAADIQTGAAPQRGVHRSTMVCADTLNKLNDVACWHNPVGLLPQPTNTGSHVRVALLSIAPGVQAGLGS